MLTLNYPHSQSSLEPLRMRKEDVWRVGEAARAQIFGLNPRPRVDVSRIIARSKVVSINGLRFSTHWELGRAVADDVGNPVFGAVEHDKGWPLAAMIYLNGELIADRDDLARSTSAHELGHAVFDVPAWIRGAERTQGQSGPQRILLVQDHVKAGIDWREWRANEFMGGFLAPRSLLHRYMHKRAAALRIPLLAQRRADDLPVVNGGRASFEQIETLAIELAELFGLSLPFMHVRLRKYGLIEGSR